MEKTKNPVKSFTDLDAWKYSHRLVLDIYSVTKIFPRDEMLGITNQLRRAAVSVTSNIAEGFNRATLPDKIHFYSIAQASVGEIQSQLLISKDLDYLSKTNFQKLSEQTIIIHKLIAGLVKSTRNRKGK